MRLCRRSSAAPACSAALWALALSTGATAQTMRPVTDLAERRAIAGAAVVDPDPDSLSRQRDADGRLFGSAGGGAAAASGVDADAGPAILDRIPPELTSAVERRAVEASAGARVDLAFLRGLTLPDFPVRWNEKVLRYLEFYRSDRRGRDIMGSWIRRAGRFSGMIRRALREAGLPEDLLYVAMTESSFDPTDVSHAGAAGIWQFMPEGTGIYGLRRDRWVDDRRNPEASTRAVTLYFRDLYQRFGNWELAMAGFNMGWGGLLRSIRKYNTNDYWELSRYEAGLPYETTLYVPKIMAAAIVGRNLERFGYASLRQDPPFSYDAVQVDRSTDLGLIGRAVGATREEMLALNPDLVRGRTPPDEQPFSVRIPAGRLPQFAAAWQRMRPQWAAYERYVLRLGESIEDVARARRTTARELMRLNDVADATELRAGDFLVVPIAPAATPSTAAAPPAGRLIATATVAVPERSLDDLPIVTLPQRDFSYPGRRQVFYRVASGDTADLVARRFGVSVEDLRLWNGVEPSANLVSGMMLQLFVASGASGASGPRALGANDGVQTQVLTAAEVRILRVGTIEFYEYHEGLRGRRRVQYAVRPGDTLIRVGRRFGLSSGSLARINQFSRDTRLVPGQRIVVYEPLPGTVVSTPAPRRR